MKKELASIPCCDCGWQDWMTVSLLLHLLTALVVLPSAGPCPPSSGR